jgi:hypothetical protein
MIIMIASGTLIGSRGSLMALREAAASVFTLGARGDGIGIQSDLNERAGAAYNMVVIARKYLPEENALIQNVLSARDALSFAAGVGKKSAANKILNDAVKDLYDALSSMALSDADSRYPQSLYTDFRSGADRIGHDPYNGKAAEFNKTLSGFPASIFAGLTGVKPLELFE